MLRVIPHIHKYAKYHSESDHRKQVNNVIKTLFSGASEEEMAVTQDLFWTEYTDFDNKILILMIQRVVIQICWKS